MAVNNMLVLKLARFLTFFTLCTSCIASTKIAPELTTDHVFQNILKATKIHGDRIEYCSQIESSGKPPQIDKNVLNDLKVVREDAVLAVAFFHFRNLHSCKEETRSKLAFQLGTMEALKKELNIEGETIEKMYQLIPYPSKREIDINIRYLALPEPVRTYFESVIDDNPFDLVKALESNGLMRE
ncbi:MAG: hypothetical protein KTR20_08655 [Cellvibrionaceae bacterium]|nr:hypothetical protein [Cellvibrionaceae bacterium]